MERFIPYQKLQKKQQRALNQARRETWGAINPVTKRPERSDAYNRRKTKEETRRGIDRDGIFLASFAIE